VVKPELEQLSAAELDVMTPDQRRAAFALRVVRDPSDLPDDLRERIRATTERLAQERLER
jgi:hypothetical protein